MGIHAILTLVISPFLPETTPEWLKTIIYTDFKPLDFLYYLPVASIYIIAMVFGYVGLRYIELSVSSPICNSSALTDFFVYIKLPVLCAGSMDPDITT